MNPHNSPSGYASAFTLLGQETRPSDSIHGVPDCFSFEQLWLRDWNLSHLGIFSLSSSYSRACDERFAGINTEGTSIYATNNISPKHTDAHNESSASRHW